MIGGLPLGLVDAASLFSSSVCSPILLAQNSSLVSESSAGLKGPPWSLAVLQSPSFQLATSSASVPLTEASSAPVTSVTLRALQGPGLRTVSGLEGVADGSLPSSVSKLGESVMSQSLSSSKPARLSSSGVGSRISSTSVTAEGTLLPRLGPRSRPRVKSLAARSDVRRLIGEFTEASVAATPVSMPAHEGREVFRLRGSGAPSATRTMGSIWSPWASSS